MNGLQRSHRQRNGKRFLSLTVLLIIISSILLGCVEQVTSVIPGSGLADWEIQLNNQYYIVRENSSSKKICKVTNTPGLYEYVLSKYYVTKYSLHNSFICFEGIPTETLFASAEEQASNICLYYLLDLESETLLGPFDTENTLIESMDVGVSLVWELVP